MLARLCETRAIAKVMAYAVGGKACRFEISENQGTCKSSLIQ